MSPPVTTGECFFKVHVEKSSGQSTCGPLHGCTASMGPQSFRARLHSRQVGRDNAVLSFHEAPIDRGKRPLACGICLIGVRCCWAGDGDANRKETADQQSNSQTDGANQIDSGAHPLFYRSGGADARRDLSMQDGMFCILGRGY